MEKRISRAQAKIIKEKLEELGKAMAMSVAWMYENGHSIEEISSRTEFTIDECNELIEDWKVFKAKHYAGIEKPKGKR